jgi:hypothetical protein
MLYNCSNKILFIIFYEFMNKEKKIPKNESPSATDDCANVISAYERFKKTEKKSEFPPIEYERPPHH